MDEKPYLEGHSREDDEELASYLFLGRTVRDKSGRARTEYFKRGSEDENAARRALVRLLCDAFPDRPIWVDLLITALVSTRDLNGHRIVFQKYRRGKHGDAAGDFQVGMFVIHLIRSAEREGAKPNVEAAVHEAMDKFKLSRKTVFEHYAAAERMLKNAKER
jgi:hypothetical protein